MVNLTQILGYAKKEIKLPRKYKRRGLLDSLRISVKAGHGGSGLPKYGGLGGQGGNVIVQSKEGITLEMVRSKIQNVKLKADAGTESRRNGIVGTPGADLLIKVPTGITVYDENKVKLGEVQKDGEKLIVAKGGLGGCEMTGYCGHEGEKKIITLDLQLIADVGLVGFPNAGKSTFLKAVSRATPKIASYPFTTLRPQIGTITYKDFRKITVADLPGLIEGAHDNKGMGHKFLKHVERTKLLLFIVDIQGFQLSTKFKYRTCLETVLLLNKEIELYKADLVKRPSMLLINKMDMPDGKQLFDNIKPKLYDLARTASEYDQFIEPENCIQFDDIIPTSLLSSNNSEIEHIKVRMREIIDKYDTEKLENNNESLEKQLQEKISKRMQRAAPELV